MNHKQKNELGFSYIEMSVIVIIIGVLCAIMLTGFKPAEKELLLRNSAYQVAGDIRKAQNMAMAAVEYQGSVPYGYGIYFDWMMLNSYLVFIDNDGVGGFSIGDVVIDEINLPEGIKIHDVLPTFLQSNVVFVSPDPTTFINGSSAPGGFLTVILKIEGGTCPVDCWSVTVEASGNIKVQ